MAKHNVIRLLGQVCIDPQISYDGGGNPSKGLIFLSTIRNDRFFGHKDDFIRYDTPIIMSNHPEMVAEMAKLQCGDMVEVTGSFKTQMVVKQIKCKNPDCPSCKTGKRFELTETVAYISPYHMITVAKGLDEKERIDFLNQNKEVSNSATLVGTLAKDPVKYVPNDRPGMTVVQYPLIVGKKYHQKESLTSDKVDFPIIKAFNQIAIANYNNLKKGSRVLVDGMVQMREIIRTVECEHCHEDIQWKETVMEVIPFSVEFLENFGEDYKEPEENIESKKTSIADEFFNS